MCTREGWAVRWRQMRKDARFTRCSVVSESPPTRQSGIKTSILWPKNKPVSTKNKYSALCRTVVGRGTHPGETKPSFKLQGHCLGVYPVIPLLPHGKLSTYKGDLTDLPIPPPRPGCHSGVSPLRSGKSTSSQEGQFEAWAEHTSVHLFRCLRRPCRGQERRVTLGSQTRPAGHF